VSKKRCVAYALCYVADAITTAHASLAQLRGFEPKTHKGRDTAAARSLVIVVVGYSVLQQSRNGDMIPEDSTGLIRLRLARTRATTFSLSPTSQVHTSASCLCKSSIRL